MKQNSLVCFCYLILFVFIHFLHFVGYGTIFWFSEYLPAKSSRYLEKKTKNSDIQGSLAIVGLKHLLLS